MVDDRQHSRASAVLLGLVMLGGCTAHTDPVSSGEAQVPAQTRVALDIPPGLAVMLDGEVKGNAPLEAMVVAPGTHTLAVEGPCGKASASVNATAGALTTVKASDFAGLKTARLTVVAKQLDGTALSPTVSLGGWAVPVTAGAAVQVSACTLRLAVASEGLGGFIEDIDFEAGKSYVRDVVLAPGPDMVRIHGGHLRMGPPGPAHYNPRFNEELNSDKDVVGWPWIKTYEVDVATFEIERTEITADQFHACYQAGFCARSAMLAGGTKGPYKPDECTTDVYDDMRTPQSGRGNHPANCVAPWEVEKYCQWVGKRLATDAEWEFAARSRKSEYACSWGGGFDLPNGCDRSPNRHAKGTTEICALSEDDTEQGLCDMMTGVAELVTRAVVAGRPIEKGCPYNTVVRGAASDTSHIPPFDDRGCVGMRQNERFGFRCARDVATAAGQG